MSPRRLLPSIDNPVRSAAAVGIAAAVDAAIAWKFGAHAALPAYLLLGAVCAVVAVTDLAARRIPAAVVLPAYPLGALLLVGASASGGQWWPLARAGLAAVAIGGFYLILGLGFSGQLGLGDVELGGLLGLYLGYLGWAPVVTGTLLAWLLAALAIPLRRAFAPSNAVRELPAGPFLVTGALVAILTAR